ncbi:Serum paraoxonase/arylesterase 1 [Desmophyllum pertusum]|uniref:Paraoxonase n=1 Tax=Desmophyllum pertusum TaxID=174260 RepID=A0A9W9ZQ44_9CNID|nr:Serum paraoxonase/arylesterase 1 [Desmophyllum pertusum]
MGRLGEFVVFFLITLVVSHVLRTLILVGFFTHVVNHSPGPCKIIKVNGSEDLALLPDGLVFVSSGLRYKVGMWYDPELDTRESKLLTFDMNKPSQDPVELTLKNFNRTGFNPHGISVYRDSSSGTVSLFVVNHRPDAQAIEIFDFERDTHSLLHRRSVVDELIWSPNDLHAVGPDSFYVTNDNFFHFDNTLLCNLQRFILHFWFHANIVFFDGFKSIEAIGGVHPNGITMDKDEKFVFASSSLGLSVAIYRRRQDNTLEASQMIKVGSLVDNINVDPVTGNLWVAGISKALDLTAHSQNLSHPSASQILTVQLGKPSTSGTAFPDQKVREVYKNDGLELTGATSAIVYKDRLLIGSLFSNMLYCEVKFY